MTPDTIQYGQTQMVRRLINDQRYASRLPMSCLELKDAIRQICMSHPLVEERLSHGEPTWFYKGKRSFAMFADHHHDDRVAVWVAATPTAQEALIQSEPERYFRPPYVGVRGWVGIYLDVDVDWPAVHDIINEAYQLVLAKG